jgi:parvulin-like peptidyl-prolyl isomerase
MPAPDSRTPEAAKPAPSEVAGKPVETGAAPRDLRRRWFWFAGGFTLVIVAVFAVGIYSLKWDGGVTRIMTEVVPYPAAIVDGHVIRYADFMEDVRTLERFYDTERERAAPGSQFPTEEEIRARVLDRLVTDRLAVGLAARYGVAVTSEDVKDTYTGTILDQAALGTAAGRARAEARAEETLERLYNLTPSQFKSKILYPFLVRQRLEAAVASDEKLNADRIAKAQKAHDDIKSGSPFAEVAAAVSDDPTVVETGGDRGWIGRGILPAEVEAVAFSLKKGDLAGPVKSPFGWHVIQVTDTESKDGEVSRVRLKEVIVRPVRLDDFLEAQAKQASIITFVH